MSLTLFPVPQEIVYMHKNGTTDVFIRHEELGHGGFAYVYRATLKYTNKTYAIKVISKEFADIKGKLTLKNLKNEMKLQKHLYHPNIVGSKMSFSDELNYYIVLEYCPGRSVREYLKKSDNGYLTEPETRKILKDVLLGLIFLHNNNIVHHDLKLENFVIGKNGKVKITDFGLSALLKNEDQKQHLLGGTKNYMSPEIIKNEAHSFGVDIWAIGVATFMMLTGKPPFESCTKELTFEKIKNCDYHFPSNTNISNEAKNFIKSILKIDPEKRPTAFELYNHPFLTKIDEESVQLYNPLQSIQKVQLTSFPRSQKVMYSNPINSDQKVHSLSKFPVNHALPSSSLNRGLTQGLIHSGNRLICTSSKSSNSNEFEDRLKTANLHYIRKIRPFC